MSVQDTPEKRFGRLLREWRPISGFTQRSLADAMNDRGHTAWVQSTVGKTEAAARPLRLDEFITLCDLLRVDASELVPELAAPADDDTAAKLRELRTRQAALADLQAEAQQRIDELARIGADLDAAIDDLQSGRP